MTPLLQLLLLLALIIAVSKLAGHVSRIIGLPVVFGEITAGLLLGPSLLNVFGWPVFAGTPELPGGGNLLTAEVHTLAEIGVLLLMFVAGLETNLDQMRRVGKTAFWAAIWGVLLPLGFGIACARFFGLTWGEAVFIGTVLTATSVSISAQTLMEIGQLRSREGMTIMGAAVIDDVLGIIVLSFVIAFGMREGGQTHGIAQSITAMAARLFGLAGSVPWLHVTTVVLLMAIFFAVAVLIGSRFHKVMAIADRLHASHAVPAAALLLVFLFAVAAEYVGQVAAITGAYLVGVFLGRTSYREEIEKATHPFTYALFVPVFFMSIGLGANAHAFGGNWLFVGAVVLAAIISKAAGCWLGARTSGFSSRESLRVGVGMISRGEVGLIVAQIGVAAGIITQGHYAALVIMVLVTTVLTPVLLRLAFPRQAEIPGEVYESIAQVETDDDEPRRTHA